MCAMRPNNPFNPIAAKTRLRVNGTLCVSRSMKFANDWSQPRTKRRAAARVIAPVMALVVLVTCMVLPLVVLALASGLSDVPSWAGWLVVVGGGVGAGASYLTF